MPLIQLCYITIIMNTVTLKIEGMSCQHCVSAVRNALMSVPGVTKAEVDLAKGSARVEFDKSKTGAAALIKAVEDQGYTAGQ